MVAPATAATTDRREHILAAAERVFARDGIGGTVPAIAAEAGVGIGTVYRQFASRDELVAALALLRLQWHHAELRKALEEPDAGEALRSVLWKAAERQSRDDLVGTALAATTSDSAMQAEKDRCEEAMTRLLSTAKAQGAIGAGVVIDDIPVMFAALRGVIAEGQDWRRAFELLFAGFQA